MTASEFGSYGGRGKGLIQRPFDTAPEGYVAVAAPFPREMILRESLWEEHFRIRRLYGANYDELTKSLPVLDQGRQGYCWAYSTVRCVQLLRARQGLRVPRLSAHAVACMVKGFRDQGGWNQQSLAFIAQRGVPDTDHWPEQSMSRSNDNEATWRNAEQYRITEWWDGPRDHDTRRAVYVSALLLGFPVAGDHNWWGHSVCHHTIVSVRPLVVLIDNSWGPNWGRNGRGQLEGDRAIPDNLSIPRVIHAST